MNNNEIIIGQIIINKNNAINYSGINLLEFMNISQASSLGVYGPPGAEIIIENSNPIKLNQTGLFSIDNLNNSIYISNVTITKVTADLILSNDLELVIDCVGIKNSSVQEDKTI